MRISPQPIGHSKKKESEGRSDKLGGGSEGKGGKNRWCFKGNVPGGVGNVIVARACFSQVYPGAQADNPGVLTTPGLKGKPVGGWSAPRTQEAMR